MEKLAAPIAVKEDAEPISFGYNDPMFLDLLVPASASWDDGVIHFRQAGEQYPLCGLPWADWRIITPSERVFNYSDYILCKKCEKQKQRLERRTLG